MPPYIAEIHQLVDKWSFLGVQAYGDGTRLVGHLAGKGIGAYLHRLFGPLAEDEIELIEERLQQPLHHSLREFFSFHNGCILFGRAVFVYGLRRSYDRADFDAMACNPWDIFVPTVAYRVRSPSGHGIKVSEYEDRSMVFLEPDGTVHRVLNEHANQACNVWEDFGTWLLSECRRLEPFFDRQGFAITARGDTIPPHNVS